MNHVFKPKDGFPVQDYINFLRWQSRGKSTLPIIVETGEIRGSYNPSLFLSLGFSFCSAVVLDYGSGTLYAHALPNTMGYRAPPHDTSADNVVDRLIEKMQSGGIPIESSKAYINAGSQRALEQISKALIDEGVEIMVANTDFAPPSWSEGIWKPTRNVSYDSRTKNLSVRPIRVQPEQSPLYLEKRLILDCV